MGFSRDLLNSWAKRYLDDLVGLEVATQEYRGEKKTEYVWSNLDQLRELLNSAFMVGYGYGQKQKDTRGDLE